ncbi:uncharacterized protein [Rutidosis leptorrhynchoides]|uniref:uncharacterized protein n=1 Tax=Rutidosis leptorrhynchoides TaxID=125765 RepID=UPI003A98DF5F
MLLSLLMHTKLVVDKEDEIIWVHSVNIVYSVAEGIRFMFVSNIENELDWLDVVWNKNVPSKIAIFHWLAIQGAIPVKEVLSFRHCLSNGVDDKCRWCLDSVESIDHLLLHCSWSRHIWSALFSWWNIWWVMPSTILEFSHDWCNGMGIKVGKFWKLIGPATIWAIWIARNDIVFSEVYTCWAMIVGRIKLKVFQWLVNGKICQSFQSYIWASNPWMLIRAIPKEVLLFSILVHEYGHRKIFCVLYFSWFSYCTK